MCRFYNSLPVVESSTTSTGVVRAPSTVVTGTSTVVERERERERREKIKKLQNNLYIGPVEEVPDNRTIQNMMIRK